MAALRWVPGITNVQVAEKFGVSVKTIERDAAEACRQIRGAFGSDDELKTRLMTGLQHLIAKAERIGTVNAIKTAIDGVSILAGIAGVEAPKEINLKGGVPLKSLEELRAAMRANKKPPGDDEGGDGDPEGGPS